VDGERCERHDCAQSYDSCFVPIHVSSFEPLGRELSTKSEFCMAALAPFDVDMTHTAALVHQAQRFKSSFGQRYVIGVTIRRARSLSRPFLCFQRAQSMRKLARYEAGTP